jgi:hypothetical protein
MSTQRVILLGLEDKEYFLMGNFWLMQEWMLICMFHGFPLMDQK